MGLIDRMIHARIEKEVDLIMQDIVSLLRNPPKPMTIVITRHPLSLEIVKRLLDNSRMVALEGIWYGNH